MKNWILTNDSLPDSEEIVFMLIKKRIYDSKLKDYTYTYVASVGFYTNGTHSEGESILDEYVLNYEDGKLVSGKIGEYVYNANWYEFSQVHDSINVLGVSGYRFEDCEVIAWKYVYK